MREGEGLDFLNFMNPEVRKLGVCYDSLKFVIDTGCSYYIMNFNYGSTG